MPKKTDMLCTVEEYERLLNEKARLMALLKATMEYVDGALPPEVRAQIQRAIEDIENGGHK